MYSFFTLPNLKSSSTVLELPFLHFFFIFMTFCDGFSASLGVKIGNSETELTYFLRCLARTRRIKYNKASRLVAHGKIYLPTRPITCMCARVHSYNNTFTGSCK